MKRAMILAAGRGKRMEKLTAFLPKPLLHVQGKYLIEYAIENLKTAGVTDIVINISYRGDKIKAVIGDGERYEVNIVYSEEPEPLETGGGIFNALPLLGTDPFIVVSSDIITEYAFTDLPQQIDGLAHLVMVDNPVYHKTGDYGLQQDQIISKGDGKSYTYANMGVFHPDLFADCQPGHFRLTDVLNPAIANGLVSGEYFTGNWHNVGTPDDLEIVNRLLSQKVSG